MNESQPEGGEIETRLHEGYWPLDCLQRAFVAGAKWWQFHANGATAFASEVDDMEAEAIERYGDPMAGSVSGSASAERAVERTGAQRKDSSSVQEGAVEAIIECDQCGLKQSEWKLPLVVGASCPKHYLDDDSCDGLIHAVRQSSPRSQPVTSASIEEAKQELREAIRAVVEMADDEFGRRWDLACAEADRKMDALITAVRQESTS